MPGETTSAHFACARAAIAAHGAPRAYYTDSLSLFDATPYSTMYLQRHSSNDHTIELLGRLRLIARTRLKSVTIVLHPDLKFRVIPHPPAFA